MPFVLCVSKLPVEIISMVMDWADLLQLLQFSHVCAKWHAVARAHPTFWRDIRLAALSSTAIDFFLARLDYPTQNSVRVTLDLAEQPPCDILRSLVLPAITTHLHRFSYLGLGLHSDLGPLVMVILSKPAPSLTAFSLCFSRGTKDPLAVVLSPDIFCGSCPRLRNVTLGDVILPERRTAAFDTVDTLIFEFKHARVFPFEVFDQFPELRNLAVVGESCLPIDDVHGETVAPQTPARLECLEIYLAQCTYEPVILSIPNIASVSHILCKDPHDGITQLLVDHLTGPIEFSLFRVFPGLIHINLDSPSTDRGRTFVEYESAFPDGLPRSILFAPDILKRVTVLRLSDDFAYLAPHLDEMPNCHTLDIAVGKESDRPLASVELASPLRLPALKNVIVGTDEENPKTCVPVNADRLHSLLTQLLGSPRARLSLRLYGVSAIGNAAELFRDFEWIQ